MGFTSRWVTVGALLVALHGFVHAATFAAESTLGGSITMSGEIVSGDAERLAAVFLSAPPIGPNAYLYPSHLYLNSHGGDIAEAIRLAELVRSLGLEVSTPLEGTGACASSCFLIYVSGIERSASGIDELRAHGLKDSLGPVGVHRPYMRVPAEGPAGARRQQQLMKDLREHLTREGVGHGLIDRMMSHASNDIYWLTSEDLRALGRFPAGVEEQLIAKCGYNSRRVEAMNARDWIRSTKEGEVACASKYLRTTYTPLREAAVERMRSGWRPWTGR